MSDSGKEVQSTVETKKEPLADASERIAAITEAENHIHSFVEDFSKLLQTIHDNKETPDAAVAYEAIVDSCYSHLSSTAILLRREIKMRDQVKVPPHLHKRASNVNNDKIKQLLN